MKKLLLLTCFVAFGTSCIAMEKEHTFDISFNMLLKDTDLCKKRICECYKTITSQKSFFKRLFSKHLSVHKKLIALIRAIEKAQEEQSNRDAQDYYQYKINDLWNLHNTLCDDKKLKLYKKTLRDVSVNVITIPVEELKK